MLKAFSRIGKTTKMTTVSISGRHFTVGPSQYNKENKKKQKNWQGRKNLFTDDLVNYIEISKRIYLMRKLAHHTPNN